jgi:mannose-6-phosphate isomerase
VCAFPSNPEPFRIEPIFSPRIWGSRSLAPLFPNKTNLAEPIGEAWLTGVDCKIANGAFQGHALGAAWKEMPAEWRGTRTASYENFPILVKFIFPKDKLSIQVHPDDVYAGRCERAAGGRGKTEMWYVVSAEPDAQVFIGLKPRVDQRKFRESLNDGRVEELFQRHSVHARDTFFIPAGTPHTMGPGMIICEVQQYSDLTYRVYDYGRLDANGKPRELHVEKAISVIDFDSAEQGKVRPHALQAQHCERTLLAACQYFSAELWEPMALKSTTSESHFDLLVVLRGTGVLDGVGFAAPYRPGECWFLPANLGQFYVIAGAEFPPEGGQYRQSQKAEATSIIRAYVPDVRELRSELQRAGASSAVISQVIFG